MESGYPEAVSVLLSFLICISLPAIAMKAYWFKNGNNTGRVCTLGPVFTVRYLGAILALSHQH